MRFISSALCLVASAALVAGSGTFRLLGSFTTPNPSFLDVFPLYGSNSTLDLVITSFTGNPFAKGSISTVKDFAHAIKGNIADIKPTALNTQLNWPNSVGLSPSGIFTSSLPSLIYADGFLVPGKTNGGIFAINFDASGVAAAPLSLTTVKKDYFYHFFNFIDINGDGLLDILTARAIKPLFGSGSGELLWLEQPSKVSSSPWTEHVITPGPDVQFALGELDGNVNTVELIAAQFFTQKLVLYSFNIGGTEPGKLVNTTELDTSIGQAYSVQIVNLNGVQGEQQLLVTNHAPSAATSGVWAYSIPAANEVFNKAAYVRHTLDSGFPVTEPGLNQDAPGFAYVFTPTVKSSSYNTRIYDPLSSSSSSLVPLDILIAGDGSQTAYYLPRTGTFTYEQQIIVNTTGTVGSLCVHDVDNDGYSEVLVPNYDKGIVYVYTFAP